MKITAILGQRFGLINDIHVLPVRDLKVHQDSIRDCWCKPHLQDENGYPQWIGDRVSVIVIHNALDGRP